MTGHGREKGEKGTGATEKAFSWRGIACLSLGFETLGRAGLVAGGRSSLRVQGPT